MTGQRRRPGPDRQVAPGLRRLLWRPGELGLARAYISGDLDVDGDLADGLHRVRDAVGHKPPEGGVWPGSAPLPGPARGLRTARALAAQAPAALAAVRAVARLKVPVWPPPPPPRCELQVRGGLHSRARDPVRRAGRLRPAAGPRPGPGRPGRGPDPGLPGPR